MTTSFLDGITGDMSGGRAEETRRLDATSRLAATLVRRVSLRHDPRCGGSCRHRNCRRDHHEYAERLDQLLLPDEAAKPDDYRTPLVWGSMSRAEAALFSQH